MSWSGQRPDDGPFVTPPPSWGDEPSASVPPGSDRGGGSSGRSILIVTAAAVGCLVIAAIVLASVGSGGEPDARRSIVDPLRELDVPPSERGGPSTTTELEGGEQADISDRFEDLDCTFNGTARMTPSIGSWTGGAHTMDLAPEANFECADRDGRSAGEVALDITFPELNPFAGTGRGSGTISWDTVPTSQLPQGTLTPGPSSTDTEIEFLLPSIVVWITVLDGPYAGFRGKLVLDDWELREQPELDRTDVIFKPTGFGMRPI